MNNSNFNQPSTPTNRKPRNIVIGQKVNPIKVQRAKELRSQMTEAEKILWHHLRTNKLNGWHFRRQQVIDGFIVYFYCHAAGVIIEVDGLVHLQQVEYDARRDQILSLHRLRILRIMNEEVKHNLKEVLARIAAMCCEVT